MITKYLNNINKTREWDLEHAVDKEVWSFRGDGDGDFEEIDSEVNKDALLSYIRDCERQIELAEEYLGILVQKNGWGFDCTEVLGDGINPISNPEGIKIWGQKTFKRLKEK